MLEGHGTEGEPSAESIIRVQEYALERIGRYGIVYADCECQNREIKLLSHKGIQCQRYS